MIRYRVVHRTTYAYANSVSLCHNEAHLVPRDTPAQRCVRSEVAVDPRPAARSERRDFFGNHVLYFAVQEPHATLEVTATSEIDLDSIELPPDDGTPPWTDVRRRLATELEAQTLDARGYVLDSPFVSAADELGNYAAASFPPGRPILAGTRELMFRIHNDFQYETASTTVATPLATVFESRRGVCQDFAHLGIGCLRALGLAARYVSGYLETLPPPGRPRLVGADASHAWISVYVPDLGWIDFDPTNNRMPINAHLTVAWGRDYGDVTPLKGVILGGGEHELTVAVDAQRVEEPSAPFAANSI